MIYNSALFVGSIVLVAGGLMMLALMAAAENESDVPFVTQVHPRLHFWPAEAPAGIPDIAELRGRVTSGDETVQWLYQQLIAEARKEAAAEPLIARPNTIGSLSHQVLLRVWRLGLAYHLTGDEQFFQAAKRQAFAMADQWCNWLDPYHEELAMQSDLRTGTTVQALGMIYDWFYHQFTAEERHHLANAIRERGFKLWLSDKCSLRNYASNWCAIVVGGMGVAAMATLEDIPESPQIAALAAEHVPKMLPAFGEDGGWEEGASYWCGTCILIHYLEALRTATGGKVDYLRDPRLRKTCWFPLYFALPPDAMTDFADGGYVGGLTPTAFAAVAAGNRDPQLQWAYSQAMLRERRWLSASPQHTWPQQFLFYDPTLTPDPPGPDFPLSRAFYDVGWVAIRNGWGDDDLKPVIAAKAGNNVHGGCQHLDVGNVLANAFGARMLVDHGYGNGIPAWTHRLKPGSDGRYRWNDPLYSTPGHNVVVVGGRNQKLDGTGTIASYHADDQTGVVVSFDCTEAYEGVRKAMRTLIHLRPDILVVKDEFELEQAEPAWLAWHVPAVRVPDDLSPDADISAHLTPVTSGRFRVLGEQGWMEAVCVALGDGQGTWTSDAHRRIGLLDRYGFAMPNTIYPYVRTNREAAARHVFLSAFVFLPQPVNEDIRWEKEGDSLRLSIGEREVIVLASPDAAVAGLSSDANLTVADLASGSAACAGGREIRRDERAIEYEAANPFINLNDDR